MLKSAYVAGVRLVRRGVRSTGLLDPWDRWADASRLGRWSRSLLAVYDLHDLMVLDVPWWTFDAASQVESFLASRRGARVFEWGSGASTVWLARRADRVVAVEHDAAWAADVRRVVPSNAEVRLVEPAARYLDSAAVTSAKTGFKHLDFAAYVAAIDDVDGLFDVIVIDGRAREACLVKALERLAPGGLIVFANVDRARYRKAIAQLGTHVALTWTRGLTPCLPYPTRTALLMLAGT